MAILESQPKTSLGWVKECITLFKQSPRRWFVLALVYVLFFMMIPSTPGLQFFAVITMLCWPLFMAAAALLYQAEDTKNPLSISQLLAKLQPKLKPLLWLGLGCLVYVIAVSFLIESDAQALQMATQAKPKMTEAEAMQAVKNMLPLVLKVAVFLIPMLMATWFSPMLIVQNNYAVFKAVKSSVAGSLQYFVALIGTWLLLIMGIAAAILVLSVVLGLIGAVVPMAAKLMTPMLVFGILLIATALMFAFQYISYRDVFRAAPQV